MRYLFETATKGFSDLASILGKTFVLASAAGLLAGCATTASIDLKATAIRKVGVISIAGTYVTQQNVGFTVFGNEHAAMDVLSWNLDETYSAKLARSLRSKASLDVTVLRPIGDGLRPIFDPSYASPMVLDRNWSKVEPVFQTIAAQNDVDTLIVFAPVTLGDPFGSSNQSIFGLGIYTLSRGERTFFPTVHLLAEVVVISGSTGKPIGRALVSRAHSVQIANTFYQRGPPTIGMDPALARIPLDAMSDYQRNRVRAHALAMPLDDVLDETVERLFSAK